MEKTNTKELKKKSRPTTNSSTTKNGLTSQSICEIIKQCGESGVLQFSFSGLTLSFKDSGNEIRNTLFQSPGPVTAISPHDYDELVQQDEFLTKDEEVAEMTLQDPLQYEELLAQREFE